MAFEWDEQSKAGINFRKHGVRMPEAIPVFGDPYAITITDDVSDPGEHRFVTIGTGAIGRLPVVVYAWRGENIRIISARPAEGHERERYEQKDEKNERSIRFQQGQAGQSASAGT